ncbi:MAG: alpha/beta hydrolase [Clostridia bacterium]|nr:alpha/beta hydrolase [Clostridia bacterium]
MEITRYSLWDNIPGTTNYEPWIEHYAPQKAITDSALLIVPGSGYEVDPDRPKQEGERVAKYYCEMGINVFCLRYRVKPDYFPLPILDGRRAVRFIRYNSEKFGINKNKIAAMGYSSGGHLTASLFSYNDKIDFEDIDEIDKENYVPDYQILCYPVIGLDKENHYIHYGSPSSLLNDKYEQYKDVLSLEFSKVKVDAPTFIWHNFDDSSVSVLNSLKYAENLRKNGTSVEMHIFPDGNHGIGLPTEDTKVLNHAKQWIDLLTKWLIYQNFIDA